jgi:DNA-binding MarR family transcriptional regulator
MGVEIETSRMAAWRGFLTAHARVVARLERELAEEADLPLTWYEVLLLLREAPEGRLRMHELADSRLLSRSAATRLVDRIEAAGLVTRTASEDDRRGTFVELTSEGLATLRRAAPIHLRGIDQHFTSHLGGQDAATLSELMAKVADALAVTDEEDRQADPNS